MDRQQSTANNDVRYIGIDWGTSSFRAYLFGSAGEVLEQRNAPAGLKTVEQDAFPSVLLQHCGDWLTQYSKIPILMAGMVGSRQGWVEVPYKTCPMLLEEIGRQLKPVVKHAEHPVYIVPGISCLAPSGQYEVMRGEETQLLGAILNRAGNDRQVICLPGTHSKWAFFQNGRLAYFSTEMTGEVFGALSEHTILDSLSDAGPFDPASFLKGVARADTYGLLHRLFGVRTSVLNGELEPAQVASYLSGLLIGYEVVSVLRAKQNIECVTLIGNEQLVEYYRLACTQFNLPTETLDGDLAIALGFNHIANTLEW